MECNFSKIYILLHFTLYSILWKLRFSCDPLRHMLCFYAVQWTSSAGSDHERITFTFHFPLFFFLLSLCFEGWLTDREKIKVKADKQPLSTLLPLIVLSCNFRIICVDCKQQRCDWLFTAGLSLLKLLVFYWVETVKTLFLLFLGREIKPFSRRRRSFMFSVLLLFTFTLLGLFSTSSFTELTTLILCPSAALFKVNQDKWAPSLHTLNRRAIPGDKLNGPLCLNSNQSCWTHRLRG